MLSELVVENLGVIDRAEITLGPGSSALTGETGAGKTLLVAALELLSGARADRAKVRHGATEARVDGRFALSPTHEVIASLVEAGVLDQGDEEIVVTRTVTADGRSKARINGRPVTVGLLTEVVGTLVEIAGQHEHLRLGAAHVQRDLVDSFAGPDIAAVAADVATAVRELAAAKRRLEELESGSRQRARDIDVLRFEIDEIEAAAPRETESEELALQTRRLENAETLAQGVAAARTALKGEGGALEALAAAAQELDTLAGADEELGPLVDRLRSSIIEIGDVADEIARRDVAPDPGALEDARSRLQTLARLRKKYGATEAEVLAHLERARSTFGALEAQDDSVEATQSQVIAAEEKARDLATKLSKARRRAAPELAAGVSRLLDELALPGAVFEVELAPVELFEGGLETVALTVAANPGETPRPLGKVASGGELSRICLALRLVGRSQDATTMVFDEVDAGVGGRAARSVGQRLAELARETGAQVLVVTHLPQVAAAADTQYVVAKVEKGGRAEARVERLDASARVEELSRMLAGMPDSERAQEHARELLQVADRES